MTDNDTPMINEPEKGRERTPRRTRSISRYGIPPEAYPARSASEIIDLLQSRSWKRFRETYFYRHHPRDCPEITRALELKARFAATFAGVTLEQPATPTIERPLEPTRKDPLRTASTPGEEVFQASEAADPVADTQDPAEKSAPETVPEPAQIVEPSVQAIERPSVLRKGKAVRIAGIAIALGCVFTAGLYAGRLTGFAPPAVYAVNTTLLKAQVLEKASKEGLAAVEKLNAEYNRELGKALSHLANEQRGIYVDTRSILAVSATPPADVTDRLAGLITGKDAR